MLRTESLSSQKMKILFTQQIIIWNTEFGHVEMLHRTVGEKSSELLFNQLKLS